MGASHGDWAVRIHESAINLRNSWVGFECAFVNGPPLSASPRRSALTVAGRSDAGLSLRQSICQPGVKRVGFPAKKSEMLRPSLPSRLL